MAGFLLKILCWRILQILLKISFWRIVKILFLPLTILYPGEITYNIPYLASLAQLRVEEVEIPLENSNNTDLLNIRIVQLSDIHWDFSDHYHRTTPQLMQQVVEQTNQVTTIFD